MKLPTYDSQIEHWASLRTKDFPKDSQKESARLAMQILQEARDYALVEAGGPNYGDKSDYKYFFDKYSEEVINYIRHAKTLKNPLAVLKLLQDNKAVIGTLAFNCLLNELPSDIGELEQCLMRAREEAKFTIQKRAEHAERIAQKDAHIKEKFVGPTSYISRSVYNGRPNHPTTDSSDDPLD